MLLCILSTSSTMDSPGGADSVKAHASAAEPRAHGEGAACRPRRGRKRSALFAALLCAHCSLTIGAAALAASLAVVPTVAGVKLDRFIIPVFLFGLLFLWFWWGGAPQREAATGSD